ncbi:MAG: helicase C-terminal domain-containing protein [Candidatus Lokiarchaeota archaeon]
MEKNNLVPEELFEVDRPPTKEYKEFLSFLALSDIMQSNYFLDVNLEKLGLLKIEYRNLEREVNSNSIKEIESLKNLSPDERYDYIRGILDIFRWNGAISSKAFIDTVNKYNNEWKEAFSENILFDINKSRYNRVGFAFETPKKGKKVWDRHDRVVFKSISWYNTILINWTKRYFDIEFEQANPILEKLIEKLQELDFLDIFWTRRPNSYKLYQIKEGKILFKLNKDNKFLKCPKCHRTYYFKNFHYCAWYNCSELILTEVNEDHFYLNLYKHLPQKESKIYAKEHSAQLDGEKREKFEQDFQDSNIGSTNVLVCTPTMELGIDIGELSAIMMRNVPPDPSRYAQRSGRAGRKNRPSIVSVFCGSGIAKGPHDQYFYQEPEKIVSGKINPPNFLLDNKKIIGKHLHSTIIETLKIKISQKVGEILDLDNEEGDFPFFEQFRTDLVESINSNFNLLENTIKEVFRNEIKEFTWFSEEFIKRSIKNFHSDLDHVLNNFRNTFSEIMKEILFIQKKELRQRPDEKEQNERIALIRKLSDMREGKQPYDTFGFLRNYGFLPNYGFPSDNRLLTMFDYDERKYRENWRSSVIAIKEFAPHNRVYFLGSKYRINRAMVKSESGEIELDEIYICDNCNEILIDNYNFTATGLVKCPHCEEEINLNNFKSSIKFPHMYSMSGPRITCDEENRQVKGYEITMNYKHQPSEIKMYNIISSEQQLATITYEHNGKIFMVNKGTKVKAKTSNEIHLQPFNFCSACGQWLSEGKVDEHIENCPKKGKARHLQKKLWLFIEGNHDVVVFNFPIFGQPDATSYYTTLKETITQSLMLTYNLDDSELNGFINPLPGKEEQSVVIFETEDGGTGILKSLLDTSTTQFEQFVNNMFRILHLMTEEPYEESIEACVTACYNCLLRFRNQFEHKFLNRKLVIPLLKKLKGCELTIAEKGSVNGNEKLELLKEKCDSELEKLVLDSLVKLKLPLPEDAQKTYFENDIPITTADFYYERNRNRIYVFVDGPPHTPDHVQKEDEVKREILESNGFSIVELNFKDGIYKENPFLIEKEILKCLKPYLIN